MKQARFLSLLLAIQLSAADFESGAIPTEAKSEAAVPEKSEKKKNAKKSPKRNKWEDLSLKDLFPDRPFFGPSASSTAFSFDGRYAAYLWRPYRERRHGPDLWLLDTKGRKTRRITKVSVMARFQENTRKVKEDRIKKARKQEGGKKKSDAAEKKRKESGDWVSEKDALDKKAPRYAGVRSFSWSPKSHELLFLSEGDVYLFRVKDGSITRLTESKAPEQGVSWLPDGKGYTYLLQGGLFKVDFGSHLIQELDPKLPKGENPIKYAMSPDGKRVALLTKKTEASPPPRKVGIVSYRDRFSKVKEVPRRLPDDPQPKETYTIYVYEPENPFHEEFKLTKLFRRTQTEPRDYISAPEWSPDSTRVTFAVFEQETGVVQVLEAVLPPGKSGKSEKSGKNRAGKLKAAEKGKKKELSARVVCRFLHTGGPNTPYMIRPAYAYDSRRIVLITELSGFRHLYLLDPLYETLQPVTSGSFEVYPFALSKDHKLVFVTSTKEHPARHEIYRVRLDTKSMERLSPRNGYYERAAVSNDGKRVLSNFVCYGRLKELVYFEEGDKKLTVLTKSHPPKAYEVTKPIPRFFTYKNRHGQTIYGSLFKPDDWTPRDKRPLLVHVYGGPLGERKMVTDGSYSPDGYFFAYYMAKKHGYVTCTIDPRGVSGYGGLFEKSNYGRVGRPQVEDLVDGVKWFVENQGVDPKRVGIHGWSFGGFQTQMCLYTAPDVFACGIAGAGPTEWQNYNSWYSTGTIGPSRTGHPDLEKYSLLPLAKNLKAKLLLVHGMEDSNVLYQDTVRIYRELLKNGKETLVELFLDPTGGHGLGGDVKKLGRFRKYEEFLLRNLGRGKPAPRRGPRKLSL